MKKNRLICYALSALMLVGCAKSDAGSTADDSTSELVATDSVTTTEPEVTTEQEKTTEQETTTEPEITTEPEELEPVSITKDNFPVIDGSTATIPLSEAVYKYFTGAGDDEARAKINHTKTNKSFSNLFMGTADLLIVYEPSESVYEQIEKNHPVKMKPIGKDALVFMANTSNTVDSLTSEQLVDIYSGKISNWKEVGGADDIIYAFQRPEGSGSQNLMEKLLMKDVPMTDGVNVYRYATMDDILEGMLSYNGEDNTLGYSVFYYANNMYYLPELRFMAVDGVVPSTETIYDGSYYLSNSFYAVIREDTPVNSPAYQIYEWLTGDEAQVLMMDLGYVPEIMPEGYEFGGEQNYIKAGTEVVNSFPLKENEYFVFYNAINGSYGDAIIYDNNWEPLMTFYNVCIPYNEQGIQKRDSIRIGQVRMTPEGEYAMKYGIFNVRDRRYTVKPESILISDVYNSGDKYITYEIDESAYSWRGKMIDDNGNELIDNILYMDDFPVAYYKDGKYHVMCELEDTEWHEPVYREYDSNYEQISEMDYSAYDTMEFVTQALGNQNYYEAKVELDIRDDGSHLIYDGQEIYYTEDALGCFSYNGYDCFTKFEKKIYIDGNDQSVYNPEPQELYLYTARIYKDGELINIIDDPAVIGSVPNSSLIRLEYANYVSLITPEGDTVIKSITLRTTRD